MHARNERLQRVRHADHVSIDNFAQGFEVLTSFSRSTYAHACIRDDDIGATIPGNEVGSRSPSVPSIAYIQRIDAARNRYIRSEPVELGTTARDEPEAR